MVGSTAPLRNDEYDIVYSSKIFDFTPENPWLPPNAIKGGTGYDVKSELPRYIDNQYPDYSIYPECDYAIGFLTRGCIRSCPWCVVPEKEGKIRPYREWHEIVRPDTNKLVLMDNNILACEHGIEQLRQLSQTQYYIDIASRKYIDCLRNVAHQSLAYLYTRSSEKI